MRPIPLLKCLALSACVGLPARAIAGPVADSALAPAPALSEALCAPLVLDADFGLGTNVVLRRIPDVRDLEDLRYLGNVRQVVLALPEWPATYDALQSLQQVALPQGASFLVVLTGWPPTREALQAWNFVRAPVRIVLIVPGPPADRAMIQELNRLRPLERVIVETRRPERSGFERLQRPLSYRVVLR